MSSEINLPHVKMLYADDTKFYREMFQTVFDNYNLSKDKICIYDFIIVEDGTQAQEKIATKHFDVIVLDYNMGDLNGCDVAMVAKKSDDLTCKRFSREEKDTPNSSPISLKSDCSSSPSDLSPFPSDLSPFPSPSDSSSDPSPSPCHFSPSLLLPSPGARSEAMFLSILRYIPPSKDNSSLSSIFGMNSTTMVPSRPLSSILERLTTTSSSSSSSSSTPGMSSSAMTPLRTSSSKSKSMTKFQSSPLNTTLPIVVIYSSEENENRTRIEEEADRIGCSAYVFKPLARAGKNFTDLFKEYAPSLFSASPS